MSDLYHRPVFEDLGPWAVTRQYRCELDDQAWPCDYEIQLSQEEVRTMTTDLYEDDDLLTPAQVAAVFKVHAKTVTRWQKDGKITAAVRTLGGHRRYRYGDIRDALDAARNA